ncbi:cobalamin biosynthesis protein [Aestuariirhabdus sp. Z084]|uniref:cobalt-precorrin 5A hydrolase n=1 Tax=Aestuariirhabdus haliotis TaxID=2918751 RepID=UPI0020BDEAF3|nr:cobalamin biosynthesis protein [Aestuariirhabdus haliotis]MCL6417090.1 cobalamin biosynthesis protein [Aestuariirhabdus haliotis]
MKGSICIFSLTDKGLQLGERLAQQLSGARHLHRPKNFTQQVQTCFQQGDRLILVCATGIAVRTLAPVLDNKHDDPAVLVMDETARWVIPLLSGHEGGANEWGRQIAEILGAQLVCTTANSYQHPKYVLGIGCDRGCPEAMIETLVQETLSSHQIQLSDVSSVASIDLKADEVGLLSFCHNHQLPFVHFSSPQLRTVEDQLSERSEIVFREVGCYGVAEAAALLQASRLTGRSSELFITKQKNQRATCALARSYEI